MLQNRSHIGDVTKGFDIGRTLRFVCRNTCVESALLQMSVMWSCQDRLQLMVTCKYLAEVTFSKVVAVT